MAMKKLNRVSIIAIHAAATKRTQDISVEDLRRWHTDPKPKGNGWDHIGYHEFIKFDGSVHACRPLEYQGAHCPKINDCSIAICIEGGYNGIENFTEVQIEALCKRIEHYRALYPNAAVAGHNHFNSKKQCPVVNVVQIWENWLMKSVRRDPFQLR